MEANRHGFQNILKIFTRTENSIVFVKKQRECVLVQGKLCLYSHCTCGCRSLLRDASVIGKHVAFTPLAHCL